MTQFDSSQNAQISQNLSEQIARPKVGRVVEVFEHVQDDDLSNFEVDVRLIASRDKQHRAIPWQQPATGEINLPKVGDKVMVEYRGESKKSAIARGCVYTSETRPPLGRAGMWRKRVESGDSPAGSGDLYLESYTAYDTDPATPEFDPDAASPQSSFIRLSKKENDNDNPIDGDTLPVNIELFDNPNGDEAYVTMEMTKVNGVNSAATWGIKFDLKTGEFKLLDAAGYGIESDGMGNFTWHYETVDYSQGTTTSL